MNQTVIIGGGVIGLSAAWALHNRGENVLVLDARTAGTAASAANAGYIVTSSTGPVPTPGLVRQSMKWMLNPESPLYIKPRLEPGFALWLCRFWRACNTSAFDAGVHAIGELNRHTVHLISRWEDAGITFERHDEGRLFAYSNQRHMESGLAATQAGGGIAPEALYRDDLWEFEPALSQEIVAGYHVKDEFTIQPNSLVKGLMDKLKDVGVEVRQGTPVVDFDISGNRVVALRTPEYRIPVSNILIAAGAWTSHIGKMAGVKIPIESGKGYGLDFKAAPVKPRRSISLKDAQIAVSPFDDSLRLGGTMELSGVNDLIAHRRVAAIEKGGKRFLTGIPENAKPDHIWVGMRPMAPDGLPVMGSVSGFSNLFVASGHSMLGLTLAASTAEVMADLMTTGHADELLAPFSPDRFRGIL